MTLDTSLKPVLAFQTSNDASNTFANGPQLTTEFFHGQELILDFAAWIDLTSNADNLIISVVLEVTEHILSL